MWLSVLSLGWTEVICECLCVSYETLPQCRPCVSFLSGHCAETFLSVRHHSSLRAKCQWESEAVRRVLRLSIHTCMAPCWYTYIVGSVARLLTSRVVYVGGVVT